MVSNQKLPKSYIYERKIARFRNTPKKSGWIDSLKKRLYSSVDKTKTCWNWKECLSSSGYGHISKDKVFIDVHRLSYILSKGKIKRGLCVLHKCDNKKCVRPNHLFLGTPADNIHDCIAKGRAKRGDLNEIRTYGEDHPNHILTNVAINRIRSLRERGWKLKEIKEEFNVSEGTISLIVRRLAWKHV